MDEKEKLLQLLLTNLIANGLKYSPPGSTVDLALDCNQEEGKAKFTVRDRRIGISPEDQKLLFQSFHRGKNVGNIPGTGLGLSIVKQAVDLHGSTIQVESEVGAGTTFTVVLPLDCSPDHPIGVR